MSGALSTHERRLLLSGARLALEAALAGQPTPKLRGGPALSECRAAFVSLHRREGGELRGCVGTLRGDRPLQETVAQMAVAAALEDGRFAPVTADELEALAIEISALDAPRPVAPEEVRVGEHGLLIRLRGRQAVLLPQVPVQNGWGREAFLARLCEKAGLPAGAWRDPEAELLAFTADVFGEGEPEPGTTVEG